MMFVLSASDVDTNKKAKGYGVVVPDLCAFTPSLREFHAGFTDNLAEMFYI